MKYIFASDAHGTGKDWIEKVEKMTKLYPDAELVFGGDYIDGRKFSKETVEYVYDKVINHGAVALKGNHEDMMINARKYPEHWKMNGAKTTIKSFLGRGYSMNQSINLLDLHYYNTLKWISELPTIYETENVIFVHAGLDLSLDDPVNMTSEYDRIWIREEYIYSGKDKIFAHNNTGKVIVTGHTPTCYVNGKYDDGSSFNGVGEDCPVVIIQYEGENPRIFTDGGCHSSLEENKGNVVCLDDKGNLLKIL